ncbi:MAG: insulinase family protein [Bacteroidales bacterium]|nr:insulinase family protein [Bacteroidales bacterium]
MRIAERSIAPELKLIEDVNFLQPEARYLKNGIPVFMQKGGSQEIIKFELVFKSGSYHQSKPLQAFTAANLLKSGTKNKTSEQINQLWDFYGVSLQIDAQKDIISVGFVSLTKHLKQALELLLEIIIMPVFPDEEIHIFLKNRKQKHLVNLRKVQYIARRHFAELVFGPLHPYGKMLDDDDFERLIRDDLVDFHQSFFHPGNAVCFIAGNYPEEITEIINKTLDRFYWEHKKHPESEVIKPESSTTPKHYIEKKEALQSAIRVGKLIINRDHSDYHLLSITNTLLGGYFGSRLMKNIRQEKGYTYGINSAIVNLIREAYFFIGSQVGKQVKEQALGEVYNELRNLRQKPSGEHEIAMLRNYLSGSFLRSFNGPFMQSERFKEIHLFGQDYDWFRDYVKTLKNFESEDIQKTAENYFHEDDMIELVVG